MSPNVALLLNKNYPPTAFTYDLLGLCVIIHFMVATMRPFQKTFQNHLSARQHIVVLTLLGAILITGFLVEGLKILLTAIPVSVSLPSFIGYPLSLLLGLFPFRWEWVYPSGWTIHAILTGLFILSLPFSEMFHVLVSPKVLFINSMTREK